MYKKLTTLLLLLLIAAPCSFGGQRDPRGEVFTGYYLSELDDTKQPYSVWLPPDYDPKQKWPLVIFLHGLGGSHKMGRPRREIEDCIVIAADGRGNTDYKLWGELDVIRVVQEARQRYTIDPDRVWMFGISMGGSGSWQIGVHFPDIFAALGPVCGNADHRAWERLWGWGEKTPTWMSPKKKFIESTESAAFFAENLVNLPSWPIHGDKDNVVPVGHSRSMAAELEKVGAECHYDEVPGAGHGVPGDRIALMLEWMKTQKRNPWPRRVVFKTAWRRHPGAYWVRIHRFQRAFAYARVEAEALEGNTFRVKTANVQEFALHLVPPLAAKGKPVTVQADGKTWTGPVPADGWVRLRLQGDAWAPSAEPKTLHKTPDLEGPVQHAFMGSFMIVHGTQGDDEQAKKVSREEARILADRWNRWARGKCRTKADKDVKPEDIEKHNLILVGDPATNSLVPRVMEGLPIRVEGNAIVFGAQRFEGDDLGMKVVYPNPLNPKRYVALFTGTTWRGVYQIVGRFGNWFDWGILDGWHWQDFAVFDDQSYSPETFLAVGFFDNDWKLDPGWYVTGNQEMRLARPKRTTPVYAAAPDSGSIYLSELIPAHARNEKGCTGRDRSFNAHPLTLGGKTYERGLGIHPNCDLAFDLGGRFPTFEAVVGTDLEGEDSVAEARAKAETIEFMVIGDGKMIFQTGRMKWDSEPRHIYVPIPGVRRLELKLHRRSGPRWLSGPADWAIARVGEPIHNRIAVRDDAAAADPISLDGEWELAGFEAGAGIGSQAHYGHAEARADAVKVTVPGSVYAAADPAEAESKEWWHWREFDIPADWAGKAVWIEMDGAAYQADAWLNGRWIGRTVGPFIPGRFNATLGAKLGKRNVLAVRTIASPAPWAKGDGPFQPLPASKLVTSTALARLGMLPLGIWRSVRVSATGPVRPSDPSVEPAGGSVSIDPSAKHLLVNGKPVDIRACMWAPSDALLRPDPARVERLLAHAKKCGFNAL
ncbi:NPCBM/NEW2 domain-containing protein, partial [bacterium]|nr:NPCBM/NEW2 domain-containing protein [bacterium]